VKACYEQCTIALQNIHSANGRAKVTEARRRILLLQRHIVSQETIQRDSKNPDSLSMIVRQQNLRQGLTHITDEVFYFFELLDKQLGALLTKANLKKHQGELFVLVENEVKTSNVFQQWKQLFERFLDNDDYDDEFMIDLMIRTITPYIHVRCNQFRKDMIDKLRDQKTLEIRKAVWNNKSKSRAKRAKISNSGSDTPHEANMVVDDSLCPICHVQYVEITAWVGCDNKECEKCICRKCAKLENDEEYQSAMNTYWNCPLCA